MKAFTPPFVGVGLQPYVAAATGDPGYTAEGIDDCSCLAFLRALRAMAC